MSNVEGTKGQMPEAFVNRSFSVGYQLQKMLKEQKLSSMVHGLWTNSLQFMKKISFGQLKTFCISRLQNMPKFAIRYGKEISLLGIGLLFLYPHF